MTRIETNLDWFMVVGSAALGFSIAWLLRKFLDRSPQFGWESLTGAATVMIGGAALAFLGAFVPKPAAGNDVISPFPREFLAYPMGLLIGIVLGGFADWAGKATAEETLGGLERRARKAELDMKELEVIAKRVELEIRSREAGIESPFTRKSAEPPKPPTTGTT